MLEETLAPLQSERFVASVGGVAYAVKRKKSGGAPRPVGADVAEHFRELWAEEDLAEKLMHGDDPLQSWMALLLAALPTSKVTERLEIAVLKPDRRSEGVENEPVPAEACDLVACLVHSKAELQRVTKHFSEESKERAAAKKAAEATLAQELLADPAGPMRRVDFRAAATSRRGASASEEEPTATAVVETCFVKAHAPKPFKKKFSAKQLRKKIDEVLRAHFDGLLVEGLSVRERVAKLCDPNFGDAFCDRLGEALLEEERASAADAGLRPRVTLHRIRQSKRPPRADRTSRQ